MVSANGQHVGEIVQVIGSTFDAEFAEGQEERRPRAHDRITYQECAGSTVGGDPHRRIVAGEQRRPSSPGAISWSC